MSRAAERRANRMHVRCALCRQRIRDTDRVTRMPRRGFVHLNCAPKTRRS